MHEREAIVRGSAKNLRIGSRALLLPCIAILLAAAGTPSASGSMVTSGGAAILASPGEQNNLRVVRSGDSTTITDSAGVTNGSGLACLQVGLTQLTCPGPPLGPAATLIRINTADLDDRIELIAPPGTVSALVLSGGPGNDVVDGSQAVAPDESVLIGYTGNDTVIGGAGADYLDEYYRQGPLGFESRDGGVVSEGNDRLVSGDGVDFVNATAGGDTVEAGPGDDVITTILEGVSGQPQDDRAPDSVSCGDGVDQATLGEGDQVSLDCDLMSQFFTCPEGTSCTGVATITAPATASGSGTAVASRKTKRKRGKRKRVVLGKSLKARLEPGQTRGIGIRLRTDRADSVLGSRAQIATTFDTSLNRVRNHKVVGKVKRKVRFQLKR